VSCSPQPTGRFIRPGKLNLGWGLFRATKNLASPFWYRVGAGPGRAFMPPVTFPAVAIVRPQGSVHRVVWPTPYVLPPASAATGGRAKASPPHRHTKPGQGGANLAPGGRGPGSNKDLEPGPIIGAGHAARKTISCEQMGKRPNIERGRPRPAKTLASEQGVKLSTVATKGASVCHPGYLRNQGQKNVHPGARTS